MKNGNDVARRTEGVTADPQEAPPAQVIGRLKTPVIHEVEVREQSVFRSSLFQRRGLYAFDPHSSGASYTLLVGVASMGCDRLKTCFPAFPSLGRRTNT